MRKNTLSNIVWTFFTFLLCSSSNAEVLYHFTDLGTLPGGSDSYAYSINNAGQVVGHAYDNTRTAWAVLFDITGQGNNINLGGLETGGSWAESINDEGQIVGAAWSSVTAHDATLFDTSGLANNTNLVPVGSIDSKATSINNHGVIVGQICFTEPTRYRAAIIDPSGNHVDLGGDYSDAHAINDNRIIVGNSTSTPGKWHATLFDPTGNGQNINLNPFGDDLEGYNSDAYDINNNGVVVGVVVRQSAGFNKTKSVATIFDTTGNGNNIFLATLSGEQGSGANAINNKGQIVGTSGGFATIFDPTGGGQNLNLNEVIEPMPGWILITARDINDNGWIIGQAINPEGYFNAFLLTPIPEPCTLCLLGYGAVTLLRKRRT